MFSDIETESVINMRKRTVRLDREGDYWTDEEKAILVQKFEAGEGITAIALELHRSEPAVCQMIEKLDLYNRKTQPVRKKSPPKPPACLCANCQLDRSLCPRCCYAMASQEED